VLTIIVHPDGKVEKRDTNGWKDFKVILNDAYLEVVTLEENLCCFVDEDGISKGLPKNELATTVVRAILKKQGRVLVGDSMRGVVIVVGSKQSENPEDGMVESDVPDAVIKEYFSMATSS
jgi:hypothetical protein